MSKTERTDGIYILHIADSLQDVIDFHLQAMNFSSVKELRKATESCRNGCQ